MTGCNSIMSLHPHDLGNGQCRWDNCPLYDLPTESSLGVQSILKSLPLIQHSFGHTKSDVDTSGAETLVFRSTPNLIVPIPKNPANSGSHNSGTPISICALANNNRNLPCFCLHTLM